MEDIGCRNRVLFIYSVGYLRWLPILESNHVFNNRRKQHLWNDIFVFDAYINYISDDSYILVVLKTHIVEVGRTYKR
jgi:hypothetical protein